MTALNLSKWSKYILINVPSDKKIKQLKPKLSTSENTEFEQEAKHKLVLTNLFWFENFDSVRDHANRIAIDRVLLQ